MRSALSERLAAAYRSESILVTGGASFIGSHLSELLVRAGARVTVADDFSSGRVEHLDAVRDDVEILRVDLRDPARAQAAARGRSIVFHLAAAHGGRGYIDAHPVECTNNMLLDHTVFAAAVQGGARKIVHASSACVYPTTLQAEETGRLLLRESDANFEEPGKAFADGEYGWAKLMGELQLRAFVKQHQIDGVSCRIFTAYGERENESHAVVALIAKAVARFDPYPIWGNGQQTRNFTHVQDTCTGIALAGAALSGFDTINVGTDQHHTILELIEEIFSAMSWRPREIQKQLDKPVGVKSRAADVEKGRTRLGWVPEVSLSDGVRRTVQWYVERFGDSRVAELERLFMERS